MKNLFIPFSFSVMSLMLAACGGGSNNINEDPAIKPEATTAVGCTVEGSDNCFVFLMEYPVAGLQYSCGKDNINTFSTKLNGNQVTGGCDKDDTVTFFLNVTDDQNDTEDYRIEFGSVELADLGEINAENAPVHLTLLDMAKGVTGSAAQSLSESDDTVQVAMNLVKIFQAIGHQKNPAGEESNRNVIGDIQPLILDEITLEGLTNITASVNYEDLESGRYAEIMMPWIDVTEVSDAQALAVLKKASYMTLGAFYQTSVSGVASGYEGMVGQDSSGNTTLLGELYLMSDRSGFTHGYGIQWRGKPIEDAQSVVTGAISLTTRVDPIMMYADAQTDFINPINKRLATGDRFRLITAADEEMTFNQGRLINDYAIAGSDAFYKYAARTDTVVASDLAKWTLDATEAQYSGGVDIIKALPISYLENQVFKSINTVEDGEDYYFPLYATVTFAYPEESDLDDVKLGIVIDENGDIRTDIGPNPTASDMSGVCGVVADASVANPIDSNGIQQYRIGTVAATNNQNTQQDRSLSLRMILSGDQFGVLNGNALGLDYAVRLNIHSLLNTSANEFAEDGALPSILATDADKDASNVTWVNYYNLQKAVYLTAAEKDNEQPSAELTNANNRIAGTLSIDLTDQCYTINTK